MRGPFLLLFVLLALLATCPRAQTPPSGGEEEEESLVAKARVLAQQFAQRAQERWTTIRESDVAQQLREWFSTGAQQANHYLDRLKEKVAEAVLERGKPAA